jgi:hypothetical protein
MLYTICFVQVLGFTDAIKISKRVYVQALPSDTETVDLVDDSALLDSTLDLVQAAREGGIHFEAHIPLSKDAMT